MSVSDNTYAPEKSHASSSFACEISGYGIENKIGSQQLNHPNRNAEATVYESAAKPNRKLIQESVPI